MKRSVFIALSMAVLASVAFGLAHSSVSAAGAAAAWPTFGQNASHTNRSPYSGPSRYYAPWGLIPGTGAALVDAKPVIAADGTVYVVAEHTGASGTDQTALYAINPKTYRVSWSLPLGAAKENIRAFGTAIGTNGIVYVTGTGPRASGTGPEGRLWAIDPAKRAIKWAQAAEFYTMAGAPPVIGDNGAIYVTATTKAATGEPYLFAVNPTDGTIAWSTRTSLVRDNATPSTPVLTTAGDLAFGTGSSEVALVNLSTHGLKTFTTDSQVVGSPAVNPSTGVICFGDAPLGKGAHGHVYALYANGTKKWSVDAPAAVYSSPAIASDGTVYIGYGNATDKPGGVLALSPVDGRVKWDHTVPYGVEGVPVIGADGTVYFGTCTGNFVACNGTTGATKWWFSSGGRFDGAPAIGSDGTVYLGNFNSWLYAFPAKAVFKITPTSTGFANSIAYSGYGAPKTSRFSTKVNVAGVMATLKVGTSVIATGTTGAANTTFAFPVWKGLIAGKKLAAGSYPWTLTLSKSGYDPVTVTGRIIVCDRYSMFSGTGSGTAAGTTKTYAKSLLAKPVACLITATTTSPVSKSLKIVLTRTGYSRTIGAWSTIRKAAPLSKTVVLGVPYAPKVAGSYSFKATAPAGVTYAVTVLQ